MIIWKRFLYVLTIRPVPTSQSTNQHADIYRPMTMLPMYHISRMLPIYIEDICSQMSLHYCSAQSDWKHKVLLCPWFINANSFSCSRQCTALRLHQTVHNIQTFAQSSQQIALWCNICSQVFARQEDDHLQTNQGTCCCGWLFYCPRFVQNLMLYSLSQLSNGFISV